jgi:hypothetical protein
MRIIITKNKLFTAFFIGLTACLTYAQETNTKVIQDPKFEKLLNEKRKINTSLTVNDFYKIQIYSGGSENAKKTLSDFKQEFNDIDATIVFNTPNYKVWVGNYRSRIEAERSLAIIRDKYSTVFLIKPSK